jgi:hypothetical protein
MRFITLNNDSFFSLPLSKAPLVVSEEAFCTLHGVGVLVVQRKKKL